VFSLGPGSHGKAAASWEAKSIPEMLASADARSIVVSPTTETTEEIIRGASKAPRRALIGDIVMKSPPRIESVGAIMSVFKRLLGVGGRYEWLDDEEFNAVLARDDRGRRFIGATTDEVAETLTLVRGDLKLFTVPFSFFKASGDGSRPDFRDASVSDYGLTIDLGPDYDASSDVVLYEYDPEYRRMLDKHRRSEDQGFGPALRRLRLQRRLKRSDFEGISEMTIARIERGEIDRPHRKTLEAIARRLGVEPDEIESF
jgi:hypothetical protein